LHRREQPSKTPQAVLPNQGEFGFAPEFAFNIRIKTIFLTRTASASREENVLPPCGESAQDLGKQ